MKLFYVFLVVLLTFFIPIPIKFSIYYSTIDYYIKLYGFNLISKNKKRATRIKKTKNSPLIKNKHKFFSKINSKINFKHLISTLNSLKYKPLLRLHLSLEYSLNDAARTAIFYGAIYNTTSLTYILLNYLFNIKKFNFKITPVFDDKFLLKIETSSIIFLSLANIIYIIINLLKNNDKQGR
ncbi:DUF2953 domain-containing protein [Clostridium beijerinckii]|uniref:DUF2953 domain-containing protein n=1 Tax=Clostridium beijerinckii TaxID=1520 RepID=A0A9Q5GJI9_CLOBE|nr:DUF2953 domain-containing protein [Clostridium beijerinckii]AQS04521.1 hypothetical protein CLBIJ_19430 [Clostridium beijerinckii]MBA2887373.1 hypothetical protein [Clostridium beijerinckii]MBA2902230.1 hypothetical protein [Clostridium beijerinckii]MBA2912053.1 hypothetical protein [Clostridium beijerinckii]MBA9015922.1 hypothetical protein [Clostridium beijerinckii]